MVSQFNFRHKSAPTLFVDPLSLGYTIQGLSLLDHFIDTAKGDLYIETDERLVPLFRRSYYTRGVNFVSLNKEGREPLPNGGKPQTTEDMQAYYEANAKRLANSIGTRSYVWSTLLRPEIAAPFNAHAMLNAPKPYPGYLIADPFETGDWLDYLKDKGLPVLVAWNKGFSQHGSVAQQNLDANDVATIIREIDRISKVRLSFFNAVHGISADDYSAVNAQLPDDLELQPITDPKTKNDFNLGQELDRYAAFMSAAKAQGGAMIGVGNTYQHLWYGVRSAAVVSRIDQVVVLPNGDFPTKPTWELQAAQPGSPTLTVSKYSDFENNRTDTLLNVVASARLALGIK